jgi:hypothetical protein
MNTSPHSVFRGLINFGFKKIGAVIPENVADQLVRSFMKMPRQRYASLMDPVTERWDDAEDRLRIFELNATIVQLETQAIAEIEDYLRCWKTSAWFQKECRWRDNRQSGG